jgi:hypothetical protein
MRKTVILSGLILCVCICISSVLFFTGCVGVGFNEFVLKDTKIIDKGGYPFIQLAFTVNYTSYIHLINPDGVRIENVTADRYMEGCLLKMAEQYTTPKPGKYTLMIIDKDLDEAIFVKNLTFEGAKLNLTEISPKWTFHSSLWGFTLDRLNLKIRNEGDLPAYLTDGKAEVSGRLYRLEFEPVCLFGDEKDIFVEVQDSYQFGLGAFLSEFECNLKIELEDDSGKVLIEREEIRSPLGEGLKKIWR